MSVAPNSVMDGSTLGSARAGDAATLAKPLADKLALLRQIISGYGPSLVAFSGGVDSALVLKVAADELADAAVAFTAVSETMAEREIESAAAIARQLHVRYEPVRSNELSRPGFAQNPSNRCYHCKSELFDLAEPTRERLGLRHILLGTNLDDLGDHRPGLIAAKERGAKQPLVEAGLNKAEVRELARHLGLPIWNKPQLACLSSRFPYGTTLTEERLRMVDRFEQSLYDLGFVQLRVRFHELPSLPGDPNAQKPAMARVELMPEVLPEAVRLSKQIVEAGKQAGFLYVTVDLEGFRSGSANLVLRRLPVLGKSAPSVREATSSSIAAPALPDPAPVVRPVRPRKTVVAALIDRPSDGAILLSLRGPHQSMPGLWELPGGKMESGESPQAALIREVREELDVEVRVLSIYDVVSFAYPDFDLLMLVYRCELLGEPSAKEVAQVCFVPQSELLSRPVLPADIPLLEKLSQHGLS
ncbi:MAG: ATP-dependent sacrificial sulfur transferase LarE [Myxococcales bacterium]|nr:ATP-dependent sacrificial sulfur transferase LarE [Myxococcales bacterium]